MIKKVVHNHFNLDDYAKYILIFGIFLGVTILLVRDFSFPRILHNDAISYIAATGNQIAYETQNPSGSWVPASEWQAYWEPKHFGVFGEITKGLNKTDIHPPLYFWILHIWSSIYGVKISTGPLLNIPFHILISLMIFIASRNLGVSRWIGATVALLWLFSNAAVEASTETRQYSLLGLMVICFIYFLNQFISKTSLRNLLLESLFLLLGILTHYQFVLVAGIGLTFSCLVFFIKRDKNSILLLITSTFIAVGIFWILNPGFMESFMHQREIAQPFSLLEFPVRLNRSIDTLIELFLPEEISHTRYHLLILVIFLFLVTFLSLKQSKRVHHKVCFLKFVEGNFMIIVALLVMMSVVVLYVFSFSPRHAMGYRYLLIVSPLLYISLARLFSMAHNIYPRSSLVILSAILVAQVFYGGYKTYEYYNFARSYISPAFLESSPPLVLDSTERGILPRNLWFANPRSPVYAADQEQLTRSTPPLEGFDELYYFSNENKEYGNSVANQEEILRTFEKHGYQISKLFEDYSLPATIYKLTR